MKQPIAIHWFRRDLRLNDNAALWMALKSGLPVQALFIFDKNILDKLHSRTDARVIFIHRTLHALQEQLHRFGSSLRVEYGHPEEVWKRIIAEGEVKKVFTNRDYEPYAQQRDTAMFELFQSHGIEFKGAKDHVIFEKQEVVKDDGKPYTVFTPYSKKWLAKLKPYYYRAYPTLQYAEHFIQRTNAPIPSLAEMGFEDNDPYLPELTIDETLISKYEHTRDIPSIKGTTRLSLHLRFGTVSIRQLVATALPTSHKWLMELIWRDFYQMILWHFPHSVDKAFKPAYDRIEWRHHADDFQKWCEGKTGYPIVDAGMRELNETGFMHNRVRMIVASFLTKHLLIDWRWGERYFAEKLLDFELASNVGGWQWAASSGCDAAPYFRIFNPESQTEKFDKDKRYIRQWVKEYGTPAYPRPMVDHAFARQRCLDTFKAALKEE